MGDAGVEGALASTPVSLTFSGSAGFTAPARTLVTSDPVDFPVTFRDDLAISFEVRGAVAASAIDAFPGSFARPGTFASTPGAVGGQPFERSVGVATVEVEGPAARAFVAIGDSITEGYMDMKNDTRNACLRIAWLRVSPLARAVRTKSALTLSSRYCRCAIWYPAQPKMVIAKVGTA